MDAKRYELARLKMIVHSTYGIGKDAYGRLYQARLKPVYNKYHKLYKDIIKDQSEIPSHQQIDRMTE